MSFFGRNNSTTANTTSNLYDQRQVVDAGGGVVGNGNWQDQSTAYVYATSDSRDYDFSTHDSSSKSYDFSTRDSSSRSYDFSTVDNSVKTDGGAFAVIGRFADGIGDIGRMQTSAAEKIALSAGSTSNAAFELAQRAQADAAGFNSGAMSRVFDLAGKSSAQAYESSADALGFTGRTFDSIVGLAKSVVGQAGEQAAAAASTASGAYQSAADTSSGNKTLIYAGLAAVAIVGVFMAFRK